ncbi:MAG TPA: DUF3108 domain-containing protein [Gemmatimonadaceae bacterium]|nr:DUF3108 domain-containing protein [Gemmatimonadaceae bacterium]
MRSSAFVTTTLLLIGSAAAEAQPVHPVAPASLAVSESVRSRAAHRRPFLIGESLQYEATYGRMKVGEGRLDVVGIETVRGRPAWRLAFHLTGGIPLYRLDDRLESWVDTATFTSRRFTKQLHEGRRKRTQRFEIYPDEGTYEELGAAGQSVRGREPTVAAPLDDGAFFYFVRTLPLTVGTTYTLDHYFRPDRNPVTVTVVRRERIKVPAGEFDTIVLRPVIKTTGLLGEARRTELWLSADDARVLVQVQSHLPVGTITLKLTQMTGVRNRSLLRLAEEDAAR